MLNGQKIIILGDFSVGERLTHSGHTETRQLRLWLRRP